MTAMRRIRGMVAGLILAGATVGLPLLLAATVGNPLRAWSGVASGDLSDTDAIGLLASVFYLAWASFVIPLALETVTLLAAWTGRRPRLEIRLPLLGPQHDLARALLGAILLLLPAATAATSTHPTIAAPPATTWLTDTSRLTPVMPSPGGAPAEAGADHRQPATSRPSPPPDRSYVVPQSGGMRSYWALAEHYLGDGQRWREIWHANAGRAQHGTVPDTPRRLAPGWTILIPADTPPRPSQPDTSTHPVTVRPGDTLSGLAAADGIRDWHQVWPANADRAEPGGRRFTDPNLIVAGWTIQLPQPAGRSSPAPSSPGPTGPGPAAVAPPQHPDAQATPPAAAHTHDHAPSQAQPTRPGESVTPVGPPAQPSRAPTSRDTHTPSAAQPPRTAPGARPAPPPVRHHTPGQRNPAPVGLEIGLAALAALAVLDRARRIAQRRRRPGHRLPPPPRPLVDVERRLRREARQAQPALSAVQLAAALTAASPVSCRAVIARDDGAVDLLLDHPAAAPAPFIPVEGGWRLPADAAGFGFAVDPDADPYPALAPAGRTADGAVLIDLAAAGPVGVAGDPRAVDRYLAGLVRALAGAPWASRLSLHVPATVAARVGPFDNLTVDDTNSPGADLPDHLAPAGADVPDRSVESEEPGWDTRPLHLYCGWTADDDIDRLMRLAADPTTGVLAVVSGLHPAASTWTLDGDRLLLPTLTGPITVETTDSDAAHDAAGQDAAGQAAAAVLELLQHTATATDVPLGDPQLPDFAGGAPAAPTPTPIQINVLGPVELAGRPHPRRSQTLNLLAYLALHRRGADRDQIATALWPDTVVSGKTLRNRISEARALVGHAISDGPRWRLEESVTTDWQRFTALAAGGSADQHQALTLVRGRPFAGLDDTEWLDLEGFRTELEAAVVDLALTVAERDLAAGDYAAAYTAARAGLAASRYEERLHRLAIRAAHAEGSTAKVRSLQHEMRAVLDLDIEPDDQLQPDTVALYEDIGSRQVSG